MGLKTATIYSIIKYPTPILSFPLRGKERINQSLLNITHSGAIAIWIIQTPD